MQGTRNNRLVSKLKFGVVVNKTADGFVAPALARYRPLSPAIAICAANKVPDAKATKVAILLIKDIVSSLLFTNQWQWRCRDRATYKSPQRP